MNAKKTNAGFTLGEVIVVVAIIAVVAAIAFPVFSGVRKRANEAACVNNMKQLHVALTLYRGDHGGEGVVAGTPTQMGLPLLSSYKEIQLPFMCRGQSPTTCEAGGGYGMTWPAPDIPGTSTVDEEKWVRYLETNGQRAVLLYDMFHPFSCPTTPLSLGKSIGLRLDGSVQVKVKRASPVFYEKFFQD